MDRWEWEGMVLAQRGCVKREHALALGISESAIRWRLRSGEWTQVERGFYRVVAEPMDWYARMSLAQMRTGGAASHRAAAWLWNMDCFDRDSPQLEVTTDRDFRRDPGLIVHRTRGTLREVIDVAGSLRCTTPQRTLLDLGSVVAPAKVEHALDWAVRRGWTSFERLWKLSKAQVEMAGQSGPRVLHELLTWRLGQWTATGSILETMYLQLLRPMWLPKPVLQYPLFHNGRLIARADFAWPERGILVETMGNQFHNATRGQLTRDCERENAIGLLQKYRVYKFTWDQVVKRPDEVRRRMHQIFAAAR